MHYYGLHCCSTGLLFTWEREEEGGSRISNDLQDVKLLRDTFDPLYCHT